MTQTLPEGQSEEALHIAGSGTFAVLQRPCPGSATWKHKQFEFAEQVGSVAPLQLK
jgi:hypothetical protein